MASDYCDVMVALADITGVNIITQLLGNFCNDLITFDMKSENTGMTYV